MTSRPSSFQRLLLRVLRHLLLALDGVDLSFTDGALRELARLAMRKGTGARGLRAMLETVMLDVMFEVPQRKNVKTFRVTRNMVQAQRATLEEGAENAVETAVA